MATWSGQPGLWASVSETDLNEKGPPSSRTPEWLSEWMESNRILLWGIADLNGFSTPIDRAGIPFPIAISWATPMDPEIMASIRSGPNQAYADEYERVNALINKLSRSLSKELSSRGVGATPLAASDRTDPENISGDFPHKTAATRAGLGWIGKNCQLVTRPFGPWVRLGTVFTDLTLPPGAPFTRDLCGRCTACVEACPASALLGSPWHPGLPREAILDARACDAWKTAKYLQYHDGHNCGICSAVCPVGLKHLKRKRAALGAARSGFEEPPHPIPRRPPCTPSTQR
jgi:epoxyqueuosine reductase QueG